MIAVARILIFTIPTPSIPWKILSICAQSALPAVRLLGNTTAAFRMIVLWMMVWTIQRSWMSLSTALLAILVGSRNTGAPIVVTIAPIWVINVGASELRALDVLEEVLDDPMWDDEHKEMIQESVNGGHLQCYLFQCLHCGKHLVWMDLD